MASPSVVPTVPGAKGPRMCRAVVDLGGDMLRNVLYHHVKPAIVVSYVLASKYYKSNPLNSYQMSVLGIASAKGDYSECEITLLYSLLRNLSPTSIATRPTAGWGRAVAVGDTALGDDVERIREIRNEVYGHTASTAMTDSTYNKYMCQLQNICTRMDTMHTGSLRSPSPRPQTYSQALNDIQVACMDPDIEARYLEELSRMEATNEETRVLIGAVKDDMSGNAFVC